MTVQNVPPEKRYAANGVSPTYTIPFLLIEAGDLDVFLNGVEVTSGFTLTGIGNPTSSITFTVPPLGDLYLVLNVPFQRLVDYQENGDFLSSTVNRDFDRIWQALKQLFRFSMRSPMLGANDVDGAGAYLAKGNRLSDLADPLAPQDAVTRNWVGIYIDSVSGLINTTLGIAYDGMTLYDYLKSFLYRSADSIRALQLIDPNRNVRVKVYSYYGDGAGGGDTFRYDPTMPKSSHDGGTIISPTVPWTNLPANLPAFLAKTGETDPDGLGCWVRECRKLSYMMFGGLVDGTGDNTAALAALVAKAAQASSKRTFVDLESGDIAAVTFPNWAIEGIVVRPKGRVFFTNNGVGDTVIIDAGPLPGKVSNVSFGVGGGQIIARGGPATLNGFNVRNILRSKITGRVYGCGVTSSALYTRGAVLNTFDINVTNDETGSWYLGGKPKFGYLLTDNGVANTQTAYNTFYASVQSCEFGIWLQSTLGNYFPSGDAEFCSDTGVFAAATALNDKFNGTDLEVNANRDIDCSGQYIEFRSVDTNKIVVFNAASKNCQLVGGNHDAIQVINGATDNLISQVKYCRGLGAAVITDAGTRTRFKDNMNLKTGRSEDAPQKVVVVPVGVSPFTYTNETGNPVRFHAAGGTVSNMTMFQGAFSAVIPYPMAPLYMLPGESVIITHSVAPPDAKYFVG
ncbi:hypothetical protein [Pseudomonas sp. IT-P4]|uniref:hypothetical protein n=1 Tax=Pseudomonas sp. IT-P4 TaxID=3026446 RepID=UPI0039E14332